MCTHTQTHATVCFILCYIFTSTAYISLSIYHMLHIKYASKIIHLSCEGNKEEPLLRVEDKLKEALSEKVT